MLAMAWHGWRGIALRGVGCHGKAAEHEAK